MKASADPAAAPGMTPRRAAVISVGLVFFDSLLGQLATVPNLTPWYEGLDKPSLAPPGPVLVPVWTLLYALMALALWRVLILPRQKARAVAIFLFLAQLAFNVVWFFAFFAARSPLLGLIDIFPQAILGAATLVLFWRLDRLAGLCLLPSLLWVFYTAALNLEIWRLNS